MSHSTPGRAVFRRMDISEPGSQSSSKANASNAAVPESHICIYSVFQLLLIKGVQSREPPVGRLCLLDGVDCVEVNNSRNEASRANGQLT
ncbi:hypothetical protein MRB53_038971 [Persea americana]|nr:hypothetical protein MRB53_038971 [Persea americana]